MKKKKVVSAFEFAIIEITQPEKLDRYRPETRAEENKRRAANIRSFLSRIKIINQEQ